MLAISMAILSHLGRRWRGQSTPSDRVLTPEPRRWRFSAVKSHAGRGRNTAFHATTTVTPPWPLSGAAPGGSRRFPRTPSPIRPVAAKPDWVGTQRRGGPLATSGWRDWRSRRPWRRPSRPAASRIEKPRSKADGATRVDQAADGSWPIEGEDARAAALRPTARHAAGERQPRRRRSGTLWPAIDRATPGLKGREVQNVTDASVALLAVAAPRAVRLRKRT